MNLADGFIPQARSQQLARQGAQAARRYQLKNAFQAQELERLGSSVSPGRGFSMSPGSSVSLGFSPAPRALPVARPYRGGGDGLGVGLVCVACITALLVIAAFGVAVANAVRRGRCSPGGGTRGPADANGYYDCSTNRLVCDSGYHNVGDKCVQGGPPPPPPPPGHDDIPAPPPATAAAAPLVSAYSRGMYPNADLSKKGGDLWRTLDLFYSGSCIAATKAVASGPNSGTLLSTPASGPGWRVKAEPNSLPGFREIIKAYLGAIKLTPGATSRFKLTTTSATSTKAACISWTFGAAAGTYYPAKYEPIELPLAERWDDPNSGGSFLAALSINRYSPAFDPLRMSDQGDLGYCVTGTGVTEKKALANVPGVSSYLMRDGLKPGSWVEISHVDTHYAKGEGAGSLDYFSYEDGLANKCVNTSTSHGVVGGPGSGHYHYVTRGSGIWLNLGLTEVAQNKVDSMRVVLNGWDGKNKQYDAKSKTFVSGPTMFQNPSQGKLGDTTSLATWLSYVKAATGKFMAAAIKGSCTESAFLTQLGTNDGTDQTLASKAPISDILGLSSRSFYRTPCRSTSGGNYCSLPGLYFSNIPSALDSGGGYFFWGAFAPLAPKSLFANADGSAPSGAAALAERQRLLSWVLWACVNGYDFAKNAALHVPPVAALFLGKSKTQQDVQNQRLNAYLANFSNTPYNQDDVLIQYCFNKGLDTFQLVRSATNLVQFNFELLAFTGTVDASKAKNTTWNCTTPGSDPVYFARNPLSASDPGVRMKAIVDGGSCSSYQDCPGGADCTQGKCQSRYLNANPSSDVSYNIGHPISYPYYKDKSGAFTVPKCSDLTSPCSGGPSPPPPPGSLGVGDACTSHSTCPSGSSCQQGSCAYTTSRPCPSGSCALCGPAKGTLSADCPVKTGFPPGCYSSKSSKCTSGGKGGNTCSADCQCYLCGCVNDAQCDAATQKCDTASGKCVAK